VRHAMDQFGDFDFSLENLHSLERVIVHINCYYVELGEVQDAEASIKKALNLNPNKPTLQLEKVIHQPLHQRTARLFLNSIFCCAPSFIVILTSSMYLVN
jgi:hypothetical protein